jgi:hypothetical protein
MKTMGLFSTPKSQDELIDYIEGLAGSEKALAWVIFGMTWNMIAHQINDAKEEVEADG